MADHKLFIEWAYDRHCSGLHNADFEVCPDPACQVAVEFEKAEATQPGAPCNCTLHPSAATVHADDCPARR